MLGNHDFYFGSIRQVREDVERVCRQKPHLVWLTTAEMIELTPIVVEIAVIVLPWLSDS